LPGRDGARRIAEAHRGKQRRGDGQRD